MIWGYLKLFLWQCKYVEANSQQETSQQNLVHMAAQIACGMSYLVKKSHPQRPGSKELYHWWQLQVKSKANPSPSLVPQGLSLSGEQQKHGIDGWLLKVWLIMSSPAFPDDPVAKTPHFQCRGLGLIPGGRTESCMPQLRSQHAATKRAHVSMTLTKCPKWTSTRLMWLRTWKRVTK